MLLFCNICLEAIRGTLFEIPVLIDLIMDNPSENSGKPFYPVFDWVYLMSALMAPKIAI